MVARPTSEWLALLGERDIPCTRVNDLDDLFEDPHLADVGLFKRVLHPTEGDMIAVRSPFMSSESSTDRPAPALGGDTRGILRDLGYDPAAIDELAAKGVIIDPGEAEGNR